MFGILACLWCCFGEPDDHEPEPKTISPNPLVTQTGHTEEERNGSFDTVDLEKYEELPGKQRKRSGDEGVK